MPPMGSILRVCTYKDIVSLFSSQTTASQASQAQYVHPLFRLMNTDNTPQMVFSTVGAAYGTSKAGIGIAGLGTFRLVHETMN